jgi:hypothetical protein
MSNITYHLLSESEPFSEFTGGAISRWAGNVLRNTSRSVVACQATDGSWKFSPASIYLPPGLRLWSKTQRQVREIGRALCGSGPWGMRLCHIAPSVRDTAHQRYRSKSKGQRPFMAKNRVWRRMAKSRKMPRFSM